MQLVAKAVPVTLQLIPPPVLVGATPAVPVTVAVNVRVSPIVEPPDSVRTTVGGTCAITTEVAGEVVGREL